jgi:hypothetical protein
MARLALFILVLATLVFMGAASAACVAHYSLNNTKGWDNDCSLSYNITSGNAVSGAAGVFSEAYSFNGINQGLLDGDIDLASAFTICAWVNQSSLVSNQGYVSKYDGTDTNTNYVFSFANSNASARLFLSDGANLFFTYSNVSIAINKWYHICTWWDSVTSTAGFWINNSRAGEDVSSNSAVTNGQGVMLGYISGGAGSYFGGTMDDVFIFSHVLNSTELSNLFYYGNTTGIPTTTIGCNITLNNYPDGYHTNDDNPNLNYSITCYGSMPTSCQANTNDTTVFSLFPTPPTNGSSKTLTLYETFLQPLNDGNYTWNVSCTNTTLTSFSENRSFILDTANPVLNFTSPANNSQYAYETTSNLNVTCRDLNVYNLSVAIVNDSGQQSIYTNSTPSGGNLTLTNTFISGLSQGAYWAVANCSDSHTKKKWKADQIINETLQIKIRKGDAWVILDWDNSSTSNYSELEDRVKWGFWAQVNNNSKINEVLRVKCDEPLYLVNASIAHFVCGAYWIDFADLAESGYTFEINQVNDYKYKVRIKKNNAGNPGDWIYTDPSVGGLNWISETNDFTISYAPTVTLTYPVNFTLACFAEPCLTSFQFTPTSFITLTSAQLYGNFSGAWAANQTNQTDLINGTSNTITVNLSLGFYEWNILVNDSINASYAAANVTLGLVAPTIGACNGTAGAASINFTFYNEENVSVPIYANMSAVITVLNYARTYNLTVNGSWTNTTNVTLCVYPANTSIVLDSFQEYNGSFAGFSKREYFLRNASLPAGLVVTVPLYALPYSLSSLLSVTVVSQILPVENAYITFERYYSDLNQYIGVGMAKTNEEGLGSAYIQPNSIYYRMVIEKDFTVLKTTTSTKFAASTITVDVSESGQSEYFRYSNGVAFNCTFNSTTDLIVCQVIDTSGLVPAVRFTAYEQTPFSTSPVCYNRTTSTASVVFFCDISNITNPVVYSLVAEAPESDIWLWGGTVQSGATAAVFGDVGLFASVGIITGIAFLGLITPPMLIVMGAFGFVVTVAMGLMNLSLAGIIAVGFLAALLLARMRE